MHRCKSALPLLWFAVLGLILFCVYGYALNLEVQSRRGWFVMRRGFRAKGFFFVCWSSWLIFLTWLVEAVTEDSVIAVLSQTQAHVEFHTLRIRCADHATPSIHKKKFSTNYVDKRRSLGRCSSLTDYGHRVFFSCHPQLSVHSVPFPFQATFCTSISCLPFVLQKE
jgi:hypothetical protein